MNRRLVAFVFCLALFGALLVPSARADEANQEMIVTIKNGALEIPGRVLEPGRYDVKFADLEHQVLLISTADGREPIGFFEVFPISRSHRTNHARLDLSEPAPGAVTRLTDFFYPGSKTGYELEYPQTQVEAMARGVTQTHLVRR
jgi:hypothetical protein